MILIEKIKKLPDTPGVYLFKNASGKILYVGKATSLRDRVRSYLSRDISETRGPLIVQLMENARKVDYIQTDSVLEALILEANLIKKYKPDHNTKDKDDKSFNYVVITNERFPLVMLARGREISQMMTEETAEEISNDSSEPTYKAIYGPFPYGGSLKQAMKIIRRIFPYRDNKCTPADELPAGKKPRPCFNSQIGLCPGMCVGRVSEKEYAKTIKHLMMFFEGNKKGLLKSLEKDMKTYAKNQEFEKAASTRRTVFALKHIQDVAMIYKDKEMGAGGRFNDGGNADAGQNGAENRIEAYDIAHLAGSSTVGVMTVVTDDDADTGQYRMFKIRQEAKGDDLMALGEVLKRRFMHQEWPLPSIIVIDGGNTHLTFANNLVAQILGSAGLVDKNINVVSVVKDEKHKPRDLLGNIDVVNANKKAILLANSEAHRFAIKYHQKLRGKNFLK
jgi:excinuclease ABC subunit C